GLSRRTLAAGELQSRIAVRTAEKVAERSLRLEPRSPAPLADSTVRRKPTQAMESKIPVSIKSTSSAGMGTEGPASRRKHSSTRWRRESFSSGGELRG